ncbi:succinate dehydrogenase, hydrophobic membrane anchor protein [Pseudoxanthomonas sp. SL93]|jgi:succinate dehydrogenase / fumarate reductase membrane anchor subunit|uniref:succinate dehydrogenase, hydrophobic membrane anchor protein n=1 Tax=Pseudoxanthomonas sp. SL93 TaxID=2995142 RepID=UPI00226DA3B7|nr:succinate dehydrogenase, hydrophobic membrane anchor protein [Pseudoxanthomonas sp. SL93]WAC63695.1 succinate dehydrogenase, hydrophobic membrane anchor protein [Pseudoxanthomonas sp. SL93]
MSIQNDKFRTPIKNARGLGSAKDGVGHFITQRATAVALVALGLWFLCFLVGLAGADYVTATAAVARPWNAVLLVAFLVAMFWHAQVGVQVVIEDYVHSHGLALAAQLAVRFVCILGALASVFAVARIALGGI